MISFRRPWNNKHIWIDNFNKTRFIQWTCALAYILFYTYKLTSFLFVLLLSSMSTKMVFGKFKDLIFFFLSKVECEYIGWQPIQFTRTVEGVFNFEKCDLLKEKRLSEYKRSKKWWFHMCVGYNTYHIFFPVALLWPRSMVTVECDVDIVCENIFSGLINVFYIFSEDFFYFYIFSEDFFSIKKGTPF